MEHRTNGYLSREFRVHCEEVPICRQNNRTFKGNLAVQEGQTENPVTGMTKWDSQQNKTASQLKQSGSRNFSKECLKKR
jgi:hypothetical protein